MMFMCSCSANESYISGRKVAVENCRLYGTVSGIQDADRENSIIVLYNAENAYVSPVSEKNEYNFSNVKAGEYYLKVDVAGYGVPAPYKVAVEDGYMMSHDIVVFQEDNGDFVYQWRADETYFGYEALSGAPANNVIVFGDQVVNTSNYATVSALYRDYKIVLSNEGIRWTNDYGCRLLNIVNSIYNFPNNNETKWILTDDYLVDDIDVKEIDGQTVIYISTAAFENAVEKYMDYDGLKGTYFSNRLYHAVIRYATKNGTDTKYIDEILINQYGCSINVKNYFTLTGEFGFNFEEFKPNELLCILEMFAELPDGFDKIDNLKYLIRRADGHVNPKAPQAAAVSYPKAAKGYIEFMDKAFLGAEYEGTFRVILHEKAHFLYENTFSDELKAAWIELGGWYKDGNKWRTTKETEFVSAYAHAISPEEDMAESIAYYVLMSNKLQTRSPEKYEFIRDYIMNGTAYVTQIRKDLQFEVYNLYPDYNYPGKISEINLRVEGEPNDDKIVRIEVKIDTNGDDSYGAAKGFVRIYSDIGTFYDVHLKATDATGSVLTGNVVFTKYSYSGNWYADQIKLVDNAGNERYVGSNNFGWQLYINNPLADTEQAELVPGSIYTTLTEDIIDGKPVTHVDVHFKAIDNIGIRTVYAAIANETHNGYRIEEYGTYNEETGEGVVRFTFNEYYQSGTYLIKTIILTDKANNRTRYDFTKNEAVRFEFESENSDYQAPELDLNNIYVSAVPTHPDNPNGETLVTIQYRVRDNAAGLDTVRYTFLNPKEQTFSDYHYHENFYTEVFEGDATEWTVYTLTVLLPEGSIPGTWGLLELYMEDKAGNFTTYNFAEIIQFKTN